MLFKTSLLLTAAGLTSATSTVVTTETVTLSSKPAISLAATTSSLMTSHAPTLAATTSVAAGSLNLATYTGVLGVTTTSHATSLALATTNTTSHATTIALVTTSMTSHATTIALVTTSTTSHATTLALSTTSHTTTSILPSAVMPGSAAATRPANMSICDFYTTAVFKNNTAANQKALIAAVVNRAAAGNTTANPMLTGILSPGMFNGQPVDITAFFNAGMNSTNTGGVEGFSVSFVDGGGLAALKAGMPADDPTSNQFTLFTHLYSYFGSVLGCSGYNTPALPAYAGKASMFEVHQFMGLDMQQIGYFNDQVGLSALSLGVSGSDASAIVNLLNTTFNIRCAPAATVIAAQGPQLQAFCIDPSCPLAPQAVLVSTNTTKVANTTRAANATGTTMLINPTATCLGYPMEPKPSLHAVTATPATMATVMPTVSSKLVSMASVMPTKATTASMPFVLSTMAATTASAMPAQQTKNSASSRTVGALLGVVAFAFAL